MNPKTVALHGNQLVVTQFIQVFDAYQSHVPVYLLAQQVNRMGDASLASHCSGICLSSSATSSRASALALMLQKNSWKSNFGVLYVCHACSPS